MTSESGTIAFGANTPLISVGRIGSVLLKLAAFCETNRGKHCVTRFADSATTRLSDPSSVIAAAGVCA